MTWTGSVQGSIIVPDIMAAQTDGTPIQDFLSGRNRNFPFHSDHGNVNVDAAYDAALITGILLSFYGSGTPSGFGSSSGRSFGGPLFAIDRLPDIPADSRELPDRVAEPAGIFVPMPPINELLKPPQTSTNVSGVCDTAKICDTKTC
jgi:hypothetical protein